MAGLFNKRETPGSWAQDKLRKGLLALGMDNYGANKWAHNITRPLLALTPLGEVDEAARYSQQFAQQARAGQMPQRPGAEAALGAMAVIPGAKAGRGIIAYHGSPHKFDRFDMSKIGTGEGAQAYGHGLYFAENEAVGLGYKERLGGGQWKNARGISLPSYTITQDIMEKLRASGMGVVEADDAASLWTIIARDGNKARNSPGYDVIKSYLDDNGIHLERGGHLYQVRINADPADFLDWDAPISGQPEAAREAIRASLVEQGYLRPKDTGPRQIDRAMKAWRMEHGRSGESPLGAAAFGRGGLLGTDPVTATESLRGMNVPGIKYLDAGSRGAGDGSRNYVVFDDKLIEILKRYAWVPGTAIPAAAMVDYEKATGRPVQTQDRPVA